MILSLNAGSSSLKFSLYGGPAESLLATGIVSRIGQDEATAVFEHADGGSDVNRLTPATHSVAARFLLDWLNLRIPMGEALAVGHRIVHGGSRTHHALISEEVWADIDAAATFAPLHNPPALEVIRATRDALGSHTPMAAVFDTAFFANLPEVAARYAIPWELSELYGIRRFGFHGLAHESMTRLAPGVLRRPEDQLTLITLQLGNGCSAALELNGRAVDTSMGLTPLEGLMMGTRSGSIDPTIVAFLAEREGISVNEVIDVLNSQSGLAGVSGVSSDWRDVEAAAAGGNQRAAVALGMFAYRVRKQIGAYITAAARRVDAVVFGGGIGEHSPGLRRLVLDGLEHVGIELDEVLNEERGIGETMAVGSPDSPTQVIVAHVDEMRVIAQATSDLTKGML